MGSCFLSCKKKNLHVFCLETHASLDNIFLRTHVNKCYFSTKSHQIDSFKNNAKTILFGSQKCFFFYLLKILSQKYRLVTEYMIFIKLPVWYKIGKSVDDMKEIYPLKHPIFRVFMLCHVSAPHAEWLRANRELNSGMCQSQFYGVINALMTSTAASVSVK